MGGWAEEEWKEKVNYESGEDFVLMYGYRIRLVYKDWALKTGSIDAHFLLKCVQVWSQETGLFSASV